MMWSGAGLRCDGGEGLNGGGVVVGWLGGRGVVTRANKINLRVDCF